MFEEGNLTTLLVDYDSWHEDDVEEWQRVNDVVLRAIQTMQIDQKILIIDEKETDEKESGGNGTKKPFVVRTLLWISLPSPGISRTY